MCHELKLLNFSVDFQTSLTNLFKNYRLLDGVEVWPSGPYATCLSGFCLFRVNPRLSLNFRPAFKNANAG